MWCMHLEWQCRHSIQPLAVWIFLQLVFPIHLYNFTSHHRKKSVLFKGCCINWLGKSSFYSPTTAMWTPVLCIRNRPSFQKYGWRKWGVEEEKKACIQTGGPTELMGTRHGAFLQGNNLHNGKVVGVEAENSPLVGTVSEVEGKSSYLIEDQYRGALRGRSMQAICSLASCHLPISSVKQFTNNLSDGESQYVLLHLFFKIVLNNCSVFILLMKLPLRLPVRLLW